MKKQGKRIRCWSQELMVEARPLEVVANTNPAIAPKGVSPLARLQKMRVWCLTVSIPVFQTGGTDSISVTRSKYCGVV